MIRRRINTEGLIALISEEGAISNANAHAAIEAMVKVVKKQLKDGHSVSINEFGTFSAPKRAERTIRHPSTGEMVTIKASKVPIFHRHDEFTSSVN